MLPGPRSKVLPFLPPDRTDGCFARYLPSCLTSCVVARSLPSRPRNAHCGERVRAWQRRCLVLVEAMAVAELNGLIPKVQTDRRSRQRLQVRWPIRLMAANTVVQTQTIDVSRDGFYCYSTSAFSPGADIRAVIEIPCPCDLSAAPALVLRCDVCVIRVEFKADGSGYGLGCKILDYCVCRP